jgi:hypothetical protein
MKLARAALGGRGRRVAGAGAVLAALALAATVRAESARRVVLVVPEAPGAVATEALARVRGELGAARFEVETDTVANNVDRRATVEQALRKADARAAFGIFFGSGVAEIWVSDSVSGRTVVQTLPLSTAAPERRAAVLAVKAVDLLKATLAEVWVAAPTATAPTQAAPPAPSPPVPSSAPKPSVQPPSPSPPSPPPSPAPQVDLTETRARPTPIVIEERRLELEPPPAAPPGRGVELAAGVGWIGAGSVSSWAPLFAVSAFSGHVGGRVLATGFGSSTSLTQQAGSARVAYGLALAELAARQPIGRHFETTASLSAGTARLSVDGTAAAAGFDGQSARVWSAVGGGGVGAAILISRLTISVDARVLVSATEADVHIDGESVLRAGRPLFSISGSLGVRL